jgi:hypothetical protein
MVLDPYLSIETKGSSSLQVHQEGKNVSKAPSLTPWHIATTCLKGHNILQERASKPFSTMQKSIQQHPRSAATLDSHDHKIEVW